MKKTFLIASALFLACSAQAYDAEAVLQLLRSGKPGQALALLDSPAEQARPRKRIDHLRMARAFHALGQCDRAVDALQQARALAPGKSQDPDYALAIEQECAATLAAQARKEPPAVQAPQPEQPAPPAPVPAVPAVVAQPAQPPAPAEASGVSPWWVVSLVGVILVLLAATGVAVGAWLRARREGVDLARQRVGVNPKVFGDLASFVSQPKEPEDPVVSLAREAALSRLRQAG